MITGINIVRNCIENGYPFVESILSVYPICTRYLVNDGGSTDGTLEMLHKMSVIYPNLEVLEIPDGENIRWDSVSNQINHMIQLTETPWIFLGNADELIHERDAQQIKQDIMNTPYRILRFNRREVTRNWSKLSDEVYHPARVTRKTMNVRQNWNAYGGDEFLYDDGWYDPQRNIVSRYIIYHLFNVFPGNQLNKLRNDAEYLAPGDARRVKTYELFKQSQPTYKPPEKTIKLPALARGLPYMKKYHVRRCLFDKKWVEAVTDLPYS